ncbi:5466_t:CDS:1, partial [Paraglomus occultum]
RSFYELALKDMGLLHESERVVMIGDDISQDLGGGARELGLVRFLVRTGKYRPDDEQKDSSINGVFDNFGVAVDRILK